MKRHFLFALLLIAGWMPLQCATLERLSLDDMVARSTAIIRGTVVSSSAAFSGPVIYTHYSIQVSEQFKGAPRASFDVVIPGGAANNLRQSFSGTPTLTAGAEYVLFLFTGKSGLTTIIGLTQGLFTLGAGDDPSVTRAASHDLVLDRQTARPVRSESLTMPLSALRMRISTGLKGAQAQ